MSVTSILKTNVPLAVLEEHGPLVSVIMPVYRYRQVMGRAISSVLAQRVDFELLLVDNGNDDNTWQDMLWWRQQDKRIRPIRLEKNIWLSGARNTAAWHAKGKYLAFLDPDDMFLPGFLERRLAYLEEHPDIVFSYGDAVLELAQHEGALIPCGRWEYDPAWQTAANSVLCQSVIVPKWAFVAIGGNEPEWHFGEDWGAWARAHAVGPSYYEPRKSYVATLHGQNWQYITPSKVPDIYDCNHMVSFHNALCGGFRSRKLSVLCALPNIIPNGAQRLALRVNQLLQERGHQIDVVVLGAHEKDDTDWEASGLSPRAYDGRYELRDALGSSTHDAAVVHTWPGQDKALQTHMAPPALVVHHSCDVDVQNNVLGSPQLQAVVANPERATVRYSDHWASGAVPSLMHMPNTPGPEQPQQNKEELAAEFRLPTGKPWLLCLTRADAEKGGDVLLRVLPALQQSFEVVVVGITKGQQLFEQMPAALAEAGAHSLGIVPHDKVLSLMAASELLLVVSRREANSIAVMEAAVLGLPVVCSRGAAPHWGDGVTQIGVYDEGDDAGLLALCGRMAGRGAPYLPVECSEQVVALRYEGALRALALRGAWQHCLRFAGGAGVLPLPHIAVEPATPMAGPLASWVAADIKLGSTEYHLPLDAKLLVHENGVAEYSEAGQSFGRIFFNPTLYGPEAVPGDLLCLPPVVAEELTPGGCVLTTRERPYAEPAAVLQSFLPLSNLAFSARIYVDSFAEILYALSVGVPPVSSGGSYGLFANDYDGIVTRTEHELQVTVKDRTDNFWRGRMAQSIHYWQKLYAPNGRVARAIAHLRSLKR